MKHFGQKEVMIALVIVAITAVIISYKVYGLGYTFATVEPEDGYFVRLIMTAEGSGSPCSIKVTLPIQSERQTIKYEKESSGGPFHYTISSKRIGQWNTDSLDGEQTITYTFLAQPRAQEYPLPVDEPIPSMYDDALRKHLKRTDRIQSDDAGIVAKAFELAPDGTDLQTAITRIYNYCHREIDYLSVRGPTDALTAMRMGQASCNGKNRLLIALLRARGIPAQMTNGLILENTRKRTTHTWTVAYVDGTWIPLCPTNGYFARIPETYLELAYGDVAVFTHTRHIGFDWKFVIQHQLSHSERAVFSNANNSLNILHSWTSLKDYHISLSLIMIILMVPIGATIVAFSRNIIGLTPFGTFMPALIAVSFRDTGLLLGGIFFMLVILVGTGANVVLHRLRLLHVPRLAIIITIVVMSILFLSIIALHFGIEMGAAVSLFPMAILSLTCERFTETLLEDSWQAAAKRMLHTFIVAGACFAVYNIEILQILIVAFPELLLVNIAISLVMGSWTGMRMTEYWRFRHILRHSGAELAGR